jgi:hypothetical protein
VTKVLYAVAVPENEQFLILYAKAVLQLGVGEVLAEQLIINNGFGGRFDETKRFEQRDSRLDEQGPKRELDAPPHEGKRVGVELGVRQQLVKRRLLGNAGLGVLGLKLEACDSLSVAA